MRIFAFLMLSGLWALGHAVPFLPTVYLRLGCVALITIIALRPNADELSEILAGGHRGRTHSLAFGLFLGVVLVAGTYGSIHVISPVWPALAEDIRSVYANNGMTHVALEWPLTVLVVLGEEWLWRERGPRRLLTSLGAPLASIGSILIYGIAQLGSGSLSVVAAALILGTVWELMRRWTGGLLAPLISHLIWSTTILFIPIV